MNFILLCLHCNMVVRAANMIGFDPNPNSKRPDLRMSGMKGLWILQEIERAGLKCLKKKLGQVFLFRTHLTQVKFNLDLTLKDTHA